VQPGGGTPEIQLVGNRNEVFEVAQLERDPHTRKVSREKAIRGRPCGAGEPVCVTGGAAVRAFG